MTPAFGQEEAPTQSPEAQAAFDAALDAHDGGDVAAAESHYRRAIAADPNMTVAHNNLGMVLIQQGRLEEAVAALGQAVSVDPGYAEAHNNLGFAYRRMGRDLEAAGCYEKFLALTPDVEDASKINEWIEKARAETPPPASEVPVLTEAPPAAEVAEAPAPPAGAAGAAAGKTGQEFSDFFESDLSNLTGSAEAGAAPEAAAAEGEAGSPAAAAAAPSDEDESGLSDKARAEFDEMFGGAGPGGPAKGAATPADISAGDEKIGHLYTEAMTKFQDGDMGEAARFCSLALEQAPAHFPTLLLAGRVALGRQDFSRAATMLQKAAEARSDDPEVYYFLGQCYEKRGLIDEAQEVYKKCLEVAPEGPRAKRLAVWLEKRTSEGQVAVGMARCELCLRAVKEEETTSHEGRKVCKSCLETLGAEQDAHRRDEEDKRAEKRIIKRPGGSKGKVVVLLLLLALLGAGAWLALGRMGYYKLPPPVAGLLDDLLGKQPKKNGKPPVVNNNKNPPVVKKTKVEPDKMSFSPLAAPALRPLEELDLTLPLKVVWPGEKAEPPEGAEPLRFELVKSPEGMRLVEGSGRLTWTPGKDGDLKVPSEHEVVVKATCGKKSTEKRARIRIRYPLGTARERDMRLSLAYRASTLGLVFADFDGDGQPDLAAACGGPLAGQLSMALSSGSGGGLGTPPHWKLPGAPVGPVAADIDGDGRADLGWADWISGRLQFLRGSAGAAPAKPVRAGRAAAPLESLALADLDGDRRADFAVVSRRAGTLSVHRARGRELASTKLPECGVPPVLLALGPAPGGRGGRLGLAVSGGSKAGKFFVYSLREGKLVEDQKLDLPPGLVVAARSGNFTGDAKPDVVLLFGGQSGALVVLNGTQAGKLAQQARPVAVGKLPLDMAAGDINGDGRTDLVVAGPGALKVYLSAGRGRFLHVASARLLGLAGPVALWGSQRGRPAKAAALSLKGRAWVLTLPPPPKRRPARAPRPRRQRPAETKEKKKEAGS